ncbi:hypothetical protein AC1031_002319 [Aphanomyces cochlioides]|nr:hypothetical protein AC1031_002319 [Aphanomyces cochlioides]
MFQPSPGINALVLLAVFLSSLATGEYCSTCDVSNVAPVLLSQSPCAVVLRKDQYLVSKNGLAKAYMQGDGNFVVVDSSVPGHDKPTYATMTLKEEYHGAHIQMQDDGNLVIVTTGDKPIWASGTSKRGLPPYCLHLADDQKLTIFDSKCQWLWRNGVQNKKMKTVSDIYNISGIYNISDLS